MGWRDLVDYKDFVLYCEIFRSKKEIKEHFSLTPTEATNCVNWFSKFDEDFIIEKDVGATSKAWWFKSKPGALRDAQKSNSLD